MLPRLWKNTLVLLFCNVIFCISLSPVNIYCWAMLSTKSWWGEGWSLEPADKILISGTFCWHRGRSSAARTKRKATLSQIGHTVCFGLHSLHLFAITIPFCSRKKLFLERVIPLYSLSPVLGSPRAAPHSSPAAAVARAVMSSPLREGEGQLPKQSTALETCKMVTCSLRLVELGGVLFPSFYF